LTAGIAAVGLARSAVNEFRDRMRERVSFGTDLKQAEKPAAQMRLAHADVLTQTAGLMLRAVGRDNVELGRRGDSTNVEARIALRARVAHAMRMCREAVDLVCEASGAGAHALDNPLQRARRDVNVMSSHVVYDLDLANEQHGRAMIGLPPNSPLT
jgi:alkylation response protein AidB-like acyl-CoA dehydrogenase